MKLMILVDLTASSFNHVAMSLKMTWRGPLRILCGLQAVEEKTILL